VITVLATDHVSPRKLRMSLCSPFPSPLSALPTRLSWPPEPLTLSPHPHHDLWSHSRMRARVADGVDKMISELGIDLPDSINPNSTSGTAIDMGMDMDIDPDTILSPLNNHKTRSNTLTSRTKVKPKFKSKARGKTKITAKSKTGTYTDTKLQVKSTNMPVPTSTPSKPRGQGIIIDDVTPLNSIEEENVVVMPKLDKKGRGKKRAWCLVTHHERIRAGLNFVLLRHIYLAQNTSTSLSTPQFTFQDHDLRFTIHDFQFTYCIVPHCIASHLNSNHSSVLVHFASIFLSDPFHHSSPHHFIKSHMTASHSISDHFRSTTLTSWSVVHIFIVDPLFVRTTCNTPTSLH